MKPPEPVLLRRSQVEALVGLSRSALYRAMNENRFPRPVRIAPGAVRWRRVDIDIWVASLRVDDDANDQD